MLAGQSQAARASLDVAQSVAHQNNDLWYLPELHRLRGLLEPDQAEPHFRRALALAQAQGSLSLALRAATSLAEWGQGHGQAQAAVALLEPVLSSFPDGLLTSDLTLGRALLQQLA
jgi:tetratricopeptide (TPR) repeat protein